ncbi:tRNA (guanosine(46)-N7)-methyltransferase TrmB [Bacteroidota bacterium]
MGRSKLLKFLDNDRRSNVVQPGKNSFETIKGNWREIQFQNENPIVLELACGQGEYTVGFARKIPEKNFVGVDIKGARIWTGSKTAEEEELKNAAFLRVHIQNLEMLFDINEVDEIWIIHPDPRPKDSDEHRRLTHPRFLDMYRNILKSGSWIHLKTDNTDLFEYSLETIKNFKYISDIHYTYDLYGSGFLKDHHNLETRYERMSLDEGEKIKYLKFRLN